MTVLHQVVVPDTPESTDTSTLTCIHCDHTIVHGDAFTTHADGYFERHEFVPCTKG